MKQIYQMAAVALLAGGVACQGPSKSKQANTQSVIQQADSHMDKDVTADRLAFFEAALNGDLEKVQNAISSGVAINSVDENQHNGLMLAAFNGHTSVIKYLLEKGADVEAVDGFKRTALMFACTGPFTDAVKLLIQAGSKVNATDSHEQWTPVMMAAAEGQLAVVKVLVAHGADLTMVDVDGESSFDFAKSNGHTAVADYIKGQLN